MSSFDSSRWKNLLCALNPIYSESRLPIETCRAIESTCGKDLPMSNISANIHNWNFLLNNGKMEFSIEMHCNIDCLYIIFLKLFVGGLKHLRLLYTSILLLTYLSVYFQMHETGAASARCAFVWGDRYTNQIVFNIGARRWRRSLWLYHETWRRIKRALS